MNITFRGVSFFNIFFLRYFVLRQTRPEALPYLHVEDQDIEAEYDMVLQLEGNECMFPMELDELVAISLLKLKKLQTLLVERQMAQVRWRSLLLGTHKRIGADSPIVKIEGVAPVLERIRGYLFGNLSKRIKQLSSDIEVILRFFHQENEFLLPGILDSETIPAYDVRNICALDEELNSDQKKRDAAQAFQNIGWAWCFKSPSRRNFLRHFLETGAVIDTSLNCYPDIRLKMDFLDLSMDSMENGQAMI